jgi:anaerobic selenocysteine-containing dehydrogenase
LCAKVNHYLERVYHPDRVLHPLKRVGPKGSGQFERVSWDSALGDIAARWHAITAQFGAEAIVPYSAAGNQGLLSFASLDQRLFGALGCSRMDRSLCGVVAATGLAATQGNGYGVNPEDLVHSRYIVLWGTNTIVTNLHLWPVILEARSRGAKIVVVDPVRTRTAEAADWHLAPRPGSDPALMLAMMHIIIRDGFVDHDYIGQYATGYEQLAARAAEYPPERVAGLTGLAVQEIEQFAREYATTQPSLLRPLIGLEHQRNGAMMFRTLACLPVLTGAWRHRGGGLSRSTHGLQYDAMNNRGLVMPEVQRPGVRTLNLRDLGRDLCSAELRPPVKALFVWNCNPAVTTPNRRLIEQGLCREDLLTVVHDLFVTETARFADYVLPAATQVELLDLVPAWGHHYLALNQPAIAPRGESVSNTEFFRRLAAALGRTESWLFDSDETLIRTALNSDHPLLSGITFERLVEQGFLHLHHPDDWRPFANGGFPTKSGRAELYSQTLADMGLDPLPSGEVPAAVQTGPLQVISGKSLYYLNSSYSHMERHRRRQGPLEIEMHPDDAAARGVSDGAMVRVTNELGSVIAICSVCESVRPGVASMLFGSSRDADSCAGGVNVLTPEAPTDWGGGSGYYSAMVEVEPV